MVCRSYVKINRTYRGTIRHGTESSTVHLAPSLEGRDAAQTPSRLGQGPRRLLDFTSVRKLKRAKAGGEGRGHRRTYIKQLITRQRRKKRTTMTLHETRFNLT